METSDRQLFFSTDGSEPEEDRSPPQDDPVVVDEGAQANPMRRILSRGSHARQKVRMPPQNLNTMQTPNLVVIQRGRGSHKKDDLAGEKEITPETKVQKTQAFAL